MKQLIRYDTFETNSSSMHSLVIRGFDYIEDDLEALDEIIYDLEHDDFDPEAPDDVKSVKHMLRDAISAARSIQSRLQDALMYIDEDNAID